MSMIEDKCIYNVEKKDFYGYGDPEKYCAFLKNVLQSFAKGQGYYIDGYTIHQRVSDGGETQKQEFRNMIKGDVHFLTGTPPRIEKSDGKWAIFYS